MSLRNTFTSGLGLVALLALPLGFMNCQGATSTNNSTNQNANDNSTSECSASELANLETQMTQALKSVAIEESVYLELRRNLDGRVFTLTRNDVTPPPPAPPRLDPPVTATTTLRSASTAKMVTATVILDVISNPSLYPGNGMVNGKAFSLDSLAREFLPRPGGGTMWTNTTRAIPTNNRLYSVNLRHLLSFTSGLEKDNVSCIGSMTTTHNDCIPFVVNANVNIADNTNNVSRSFFYNGAHLFVAAQMAVNASGLGSWAALFKRFKEVHGVFQSSIPSPDADNMGVGAFYPNSSPSTTTSSSSPNPAGAMQYQAGDYAPFLVKLANAQIISQALLNEMMSDQMDTPNTFIKYSPMQDDEEEWPYGLGLWNECPVADFTLACLEDRYSSPGTFGSYPFVDFNLWDGTSYLFVGFVGRAGDTSAQAIKGINFYRAMGGGKVGVKDLAQKWAANKCP